jgi:hypothetical protein
MFVRYLVVALLASLAVGCGLHVNFGGPARVGSGVVVTQSRPVGEFRYVKAGGAVELDIAVAEEASLEIEFDDNLHEIVSVETVGDNLTIRTLENYRSKQALKVRLTTPALAGVDLSGASTAQIKGVNSDSFEIQLSGASSASIDGVARQLTADASGASKINCMGLEAETVDASLSGASSAEVHVTAALLVDASGASQVLFKGNPPRIEKRISGASSVQPVAD